MESIEAEVCAESGKRDRKGRRMLGRNEWYRLMGEYDASGLTQEVFCHREGVNYHTFVAWLGRRKRDDGPPPKTAPDKFHELSVKLPSWHGILEVTLPDGTVVRGDNAGSLSELIRLLRG